MYVFPCYISSTASVQECGTDWYLYSPFWVARMIFLSIKLTVSHVETVYGYCEMGSHINWETGQSSIF